MRRVFLIGLMACVCLRGARARAETSSPWRFDGTSDGLTVERREVPGSSFDEIRISATRGLDLARVCDVIYDKRGEVQSGVRFKRREILRESDSERWVYEQIAVPWVSDRDYVMHTKIEQPASSGRCEVSFQTENDETRPPLRGFVRIPVIRGHWSVGPLVDGRLSIRYSVFSDPGGIPAFLARGGQRSAAVDFVKVVLHRAAVLGPKTAVQPTARLASAQPAHASLAVNHPPASQ